MADGEAMLHRLVGPRDGGEPDLRPADHEERGVAHRTRETTRPRLADYPVTDLGLAGRPEWTEDPADRDNQARRECRPELVARIQEVLRTRTRTEWLEAFAAAGVPAGPINTVADLARDDDLLDRGTLFSIPVDDASPVPQVGTGWHLDGAANGGATAPRPLGADTDDVLQRWAGLGPAEIEALRAA